MNNSLQLPVSAKEQRPMVLASNLKFLIFFGLITSVAAVASAEDDANEEIEDIEDLSLTSAMLSFSPTTDGTPPCPLWDERS